MQSFFMQELEKLKKRIVKMLFLVTGQLEKALRGFAGPPVFYLAGGAKAYSDFLNQQFAMQNRRTMTLASGGGPKFVGGSRVGGGAGGCCGRKK